MPLHAVPNLRINAVYARGDWDGYCNIIWDRAVEIDNVFFRIEYHVIGTPGGTWSFQADVPWGIGYWGVAVLFAHATPGGGLRTRVVDTIRVTTYDTTNVLPPVGVTIATPTSLVSTIPSQNYNYVIATYGEIGAAIGSANINWANDTKFITNGRITLTKYGLTSPAVIQTLIDWSFGGKVGNLGPFATYMPFDLLHQGIQLTFPYVWDPNNPPTNNPGAPRWVAEGDTLTLTVTISNELGSSTSVQSFTYFHSLACFQFADVATKNQPYSRQLQVIQDIWYPIPYLAKSWGGYGFPTGMTLDTTTGILSGTPTVVGSFPIVVQPIGFGNTGTIEELLIVVNVTGIPVMKAPPGGMILAVGLPYMHAYDAYATNNPTSYAVTGTMPPGLTLDTATGDINGTPTTPGTYNMSFTATNSAGTSAPYAISMEVDLFDPPTITSPNTMSVYLGLLSSYTITTNLVAQTFRTSPLPNGLILTGRVITGIPDDIPGEYTVGLQAANRWGWGGVFQLKITVGIAPPVITSSLNLETFVDEGFTYQIVASNSPSSYGASPLPPGLIVDQEHGIISGIPTSENPDGYHINIQAVNPGGSVTALLILKVLLPPVPVINTDATHGRAITWDTSRPFTFTPSATHSPDTWTADPRPAGLAFSATDGSLTGQFASGGLYQVGFTAHNRGGWSDLATFNFLISIGATEAEVINQLGTVAEIWINVDTAIVGVGNILTIDNDTVVVPTSTTLSIKRGDSTEIHVIFHEDGIPIDLSLNTLKFGIKGAFDDEFVVYSDRFTTLGGPTGTGGRFQIYPDFSGTNDDLDAVLVTATTTMMGEVQWEMFDPQGAIIRRSSIIFDVAIIRDLIHPD